MVNILKFYKKYHKIISRVYSNKRIFLWNFRMLIIKKVYIYKIDKYFSLKDNKNVISKNFDICIILSKT